MPDDKKVSAMTDVTLTVDGDTYVYCVTPDGKAKMSAFLKQFARELVFEYNDSPIDQDPGAGLFTINGIQANQATATVLWINDIGQNGTDVGQQAIAWPAGTVLQLEDVANPANIYECKITSAPNDNTGWWTINMANVLGAGLVDGNKYRLRNIGLIGLGVVGQLYSAASTVKEPTGTTQTIDWDDGNLHTVDLASATGDVTLTMINPKAGASYMIKFIQGATARDVVLPANVLMLGGTAPTTLDITAVDDAIDTLTLVYDESGNYLAQLGQVYG